MRDVSKIVRTLRDGNNIKSQMECVLAVHGLHFRLTKNNIVIGIRNFEFSKHHLQKNGAW
jgi:hypothetical protein